MLCCLVGACFQRGQEVRAVEKIAVAISSQIPGAIHVSDYPLNVAKMAITVLSREEFLRLTSGQVFTYLKSDPPYHNRLGMTFDISHTLTRYYIGQ
ncbi:MAG: hypothetical protein NTY61_02465, partial [Candidatus Parcubacteria bacterium]|nr:hypothetical protein [Candidatus Parcubacteria bacterium]